MWLVTIALLALTLVVYLPATQCQYIWDDDDYVTNNETLTSIGGLWRIWAHPEATPQFYPLVHTTYWIEYRIWGLWPAGYHTTNILLHGLATCLLGMVLSRLNVPGAWLAAAIFAVHPVHVESVAWITERKNTLSAVFYLLAALTYLKSRESETKPNWPWYAATIVLFCCALLSKTVTVTLPAALLLVTWWKFGKITRRDIAFLTPMFLLAIPFGLLTAWLETHHVGTRHIDLGLSPIERLLVAGRAFWFYVGKLLLPVELTFIYPRWEASAAVWWQYLFPISFFALIAGLWTQRQRIGRGPLAAGLFFAGTLAPALGFVDVFPMRYSFVADHFQYLASIGIIVLVAAIVATKLTPRFHRSQLIFAASLLLAILGVLTWRQCGIYTDAETLWRDTIDKNPKAAIAYTNLGNLYTRENRNLDEAIRLLTTAIQLKTDDPADAYSNRAVARQLRGDLPGALEDFTAAIEAGSADINLWWLRARLHAEFGDNDQAIADLDHVLDEHRKAEGISADSPEFLLMRGMARYSIMQDKLADADIAEYLRHRPQETTMIQNMVNEAKRNRVAKPTGF